MPRPTLCVAIVFFWLVMTGWLVKDEVLPKLGFGDLDYKAVLQERARRQVTRWNISLGERHVGKASTNVEPQTDGSFGITTSLLLNMSEFSRLPVVPPSDTNAATMVEIISEIFVDPLGRLETVSVELALTPPNTRTPLRVNIEGEVRGQHLDLKIQGLGSPFEELRLPINSESFFADNMVPLDRLPNLRVGKKWTTRSVNPSVALSGPFSVFFGGQSVEVVQNEVTSIEAIQIDGRSWRCFVVEHRRDEKFGVTWVRVSDGRVLRREVLFGGLQLDFSLDLSRENLDEL
jgi:hypothetical protein